MCDAPMAMSDRIERKFIDLGNGPVVVFIGSRYCIQRLLAWSGPCRKNKRGIVFFLSLCLLFISWVMRNWDSNIVRLFVRCDGHWSADAGHVDRFNPAEEFGPVIQQADADRRRSGDFDHPGAAQLERQRPDRPRARHFQSKLLPFSQPFG